MVVQCLDADSSRLVVISCVADVQCVAEVPLHVLPAGKRDSETDAPSHTRQMLLHVELFNTMDAATESAMEKKGYQDSSMRHMH